jgi:lysophospholipase L1-like esterase
MLHIPEFPIADVGERALYSQIVTNKTAMEVIMKSYLLGLVLLLGIAISPVYAKDNTVPLKSGQTIAFLGDSITAAGAREGGYCKLVLDGLKREGIEAKGVFAGIGGHKSNQMLARLDKDVLSKKPDWMTLSCGVNDVWHGKNGVALEPYKTNITEIVDRCQAAGIKVMLLTSTMIKEDQNNGLNQKLAPYNEYLRELAKTKKCLIADLNADMQEALKTFPKDAPKGKQLTGDGVHMNAYGNIMMAKGVLRALSVSNEKLDTLGEEWKKAPGSKRIRMDLSMSLYEYEQIQAKEGKRPEEVMKEWLEVKKLELLKKTK